jgi:hypothetical protein
VPTENKGDDNQDPLNGDKVEPGPFNEGQMGGGSGTHVERDGAQVQPNTSSIKYSMPSISTNSG